MQRIFSSITAALLAGQLTSSIVNCSDAESNAFPSAWIAPAAGSLDLTDLFEKPSEWSLARKLVSTVQFYQEATFQNQIPYFIGANNYFNLASADVFKKAKNLGLELSLETYVIKPLYCKSENGAYNAARDTMQAIQSIENAGAKVGFLSMQEPFFEGKTQNCWQHDFVNARFVSKYMSVIKQAYPEIQIGLIEPYPAISAATLNDLMQLLDKESSKPDFLHLDIDYKKVSSQYKLNVDLSIIESNCKKMGVPFGILIFGYDGNSDQLFFDEARQLANMVLQSGVKPRLIFQSWARSTSNHVIIPSNLPEYAPNTMTNFIINTMKMFSK